MATSAEELNSPFVDARSFEAPTQATVRRFGLASPFVEAFTFEPAGSQDSRDAVRRVLKAQLYNEELDDAIYELIGETAAFAGNGDARLAAAAARMRLAPLAEAIESFIDRSAEEFGDRESGTFSESEIDDVIGRVSAEQEVAPAFEHFFGSIVNAVKSAAKGAVSLAKKGIEVATTLGLGPLLKRLGGLVKPLLERVLKAAINRLPVALQPAARQLASRLPSLFGKEIESIPEEEVAMDVGAIQSEFNDRTVDALLGETDRGEEAEAGSWTHGQDEVGIGDLDGARERFVRELDALGEGEDAGPAVEHFIPALLPVLKLGLKIAGRKRVVGVLSGLVAKLIGRFVGPQSSGALSTALVDAGLKLIGLEVSDGDQKRAAHAAIAATVEETVRRVATLPDAVLDNEALLEGSIVRSFEEAAAANLPPVLPAAVYRRRPELIETDSHHGTWIACPMRGPKRYKKFTRVIRTRITPHAAMTVTTFGEAPLAQYLQEQLGLDPGEELEAQVHLYESLPGTLLGEVARLEGNGSGTTEFHPLTPEAAAMLVQEPGLGRAMSPESRSAPGRLAVGQRFYRMVIPGRRVATIPGGGALGRHRRRTHLRTVLDFPNDKIRLHLFLSERRAQELAAALRQQGHAGAVATTLKGFIDRGLHAAHNGHATGRIRIIHETVSLPEARGGALARLPKAAVQAFTSRVGEWTLTALTDFLSSQAPRFIAATEDAKDGVTVTITLANPPGMAAMRNGLAGAPAGAATATTQEVASVQVDVTPGFAHG